MVVTAHAHVLVRIQNLLVIHPVEHNEGRPALQALLKSCRRFTQCRQWFELWQQVELASKGFELLFEGGFDCGAILAALWQACIQPTDGGFGMREVREQSTGSTAASHPLTRGRAERCQVCH